jgi:curved DNA-binding protein CbpA
VVQEQPFVDHYEVLQLSQNADAEMIERVYRLLAKRFHPDNGASGDEARFREVHDAYDVLSDREKRAEFDVEFDRQKKVKWQIFDQGSSQDVQQQDQRIFHGVLSLLYAARRRNPSKGGLGPLYFEEMLGIPREHLEFPLWYLKKRGYTEILETGEVAITVDGIDSMNDRKMSLPDNRLLEQATGSEPSPPGTDAPDIDGVARAG